MVHSLIEIRPPMGNPFAADAPIGARSESTGEQAAVTVRFDAGMDFYRQIVLKRDGLDDLLDAAEQRLKKNPAIGSLPRRRAAVERVAANRAGWTDRINAARHLLEQSDGISPPDPADTVMLLDTLDTLLDLLSAACSPLELSRRGVSHPGLQRIEDIAAFCRSDTANPFHAYARLADPMAGLETVPDMAICLVTRADHVAAAASLLSVWQRKWPQTVWLAGGSQVLVDAVHQAIGIKADRFSDDLHTVRQRFQCQWNGRTGSGPETQTSDEIIGSGKSDQRILNRRLHETDMAGTLESALGKSVRTIAWDDPKGDPKAIIAGLYQASRNGIWNHLVLPDEDPSPLENEMAAFAAANPGIVHSWCRRAAPVSAFSCSLEHYSEGAASYGETIPLPGLPVWQILADVELMSAFHTKFGLKAVTRLRYRPEDGTLLALGQSLAYSYVKPGQLPAGYLDEICRMVEAGGSVAVRWVRHNLERAFLIAYVVEHGVIVGNSSLKHPREEYIEAVSKQSGIDLQHYLERGYTSVRPEYRGLGVGAKLLEGLTKRAGDYKIFSVIGEDNLPTQKMAVRNRTCKVATFYSQRAEKPVGVWIPEWMLPEGVVLPPQPSIE